MILVDAIVYATAMREPCPVVTSDPHFEGLKDVIYIEA
jgi:PIN domain nuclease of toxin-antitoxin system